MKPLWRLQSGRFAGWRTEDGELYDDDGIHLGYFVKEIAYLNNGRAIGEIYGGRWLGRREDVIYPTGTRHGLRQSRDPARLPDRNGMPLAGWIDPEL
jgi:hypothetical protein